MKPGLSDNGIEANQDRDAVGGLRLTRFDLIAFVIIALTATLAMLPIFLNGSVAGDDSMMHYRRAADFFDAIRAGAIYPRWLPRSNYGQGSPVMMYYPPVSYYAVAAFRTFIRDPLLAFKLGDWLALVVSGASMYVFSRSLISRPASLLAALLYMTAAYHLFDVYHRAALGEYWSFAWLPLVLDGACRVAFGRGRRSVAYLAAGYALLLLTHVTISFELTLLLPMLVLLLTHDSRRIAQVISGLGLGGMMSAVFTVPLQTEISYIRIDRALRIPFSKFFLFENLDRAFESYVFPPPGGRPHHFLDGLNLIAIGLTLMFLVSAFVILRMRVEIRQSRLAAIAPAAAVVTSVSLVLTMALSAPVWRAIPQFAYIQFPFRWLTTATLGATILAGIAVSCAARRIKSNKVSLAALAVVLGFNIMIATLVVMKTSYDPPEVADDARSQFEVAEYRTVWLDRQKRLDEIEKSAATVLSGDAIVNVIDDFGARQRYDIEANSASTIKLRTLYFPGWIARVDGEPVGISPDQEGNIQLSVEAGAHTVTLSFEDTRPRKAGKLISAMGLAIWIVVVAAVFRRKGSGKEQ